MSLESATYIDGLIPTNPTGSDPVAQADDHIRLIKSTLKNTFPNINAAVVPSDEDLNTRLVPSGVILMWSGSVGTIPASWKLCDGTAGTPDLRSRFIVGAGSSYTVGATGGANTASSAPAGGHGHTTDVQGAHSHGGATLGHALTIGQMPSHTHTGTQMNVWGVDYDDGQGVHVGGSEVGYTGGNEEHAHALYVDGSHTHNVYGVADHVHTVDTRSPYYALCFIMKV